MIERIQRCGSVLPTALAVAVLVSAACGGSGDVPQEDAPVPAGADASSGDDGAAAPPSGPVDEELAERGEALFQEKGCIACHTIGGGRLTGPDLAGVGERRDWPWIVHMVTNPDSMTRNDPVAQGLMAEYMTPMPDLNVTPDEVRALYEHIRHESAEAGAGSDDESDDNDEEDDG